MNDSSPPSPPAKRRINFGRRRSDWLVPLLFMGAAAIAAAWAYTSYLQREDMAELKKGLEVQTRLRERQLRFYEKTLEKKALEKKALEQKILQRKAPEKKPGNIKPQYRGELRPQDAPPEMA